ncbi:MAG: hypothetical protein IMX00_10410 [Limnochordales bacterium]|nr:hypothetical protein [Limnochordales bacterium]
MKIEGLIRVELSPEELGWKNEVAYLQGVRSTMSGPAGTSPQEDESLAVQVERVKDLVRETLVRSLTEAAIAKMVLYTEGSSVRLMALVETESGLPSQPVGTPAD